MTELRLLLSTVDDEAQARRLARLWVESRRAACVTILPGANSVYRYEGKVHEDAELVLLIKTAVLSEDELDRRIAGFAADHPYDEPEFIAFRPDAGAAGYLRWCREQVEPEA